MRAGPECVRTDAPEIPACGVNWATRGVVFVASHGDAGETLDGHPVDARGAAMTTSVPDPKPAEPVPAAEAALTDYADLGTAFGLDASVASAHAQEPPAAGPVAPPWEYRLTRRTSL